MESWSGQTYEAILAIPVTRRHRLVIEKGELERKRQEAHRQAVSRARARGRRR